MIFGDEKLKLRFAPCHVALSSISSGLTQIATLRFATSHIRKTLYAIGYYCMQEGEQK
jgi:hypothetical protein